jgi:hypothetical protein
LTLAGGTKSSVNLTNDTSIIDAGEPK